MQKPLNGLDVCASCVCRHMCLCVRVNTSDTPRRAPCKSCKKVPPHDVTVCASALQIHAIRTHACAWAEAGCTKMDWQSSGFWFHNTLMPGVPWHRAAYPVFPVPRYNTFPIGPLHQCIFIKSRVLLSFLPLFVSWSPPLLIPASSLPFSLRVRATCQTTTLRFLFFPNKFLGWFHRLL